MSGEFTMITFNLTAELVTKNSCENGDAEKRGFLDDSGQLTEERCDSNFTLKDLCGEGLHYLYWERSSDTWITCYYNASEMFSKPENIWSFMDDDSVDSDVLSGSISVHRPANISNASWERVIKHLEKVG